MHLYYSLVKHLMRWCDVSCAVFAVSPLWFPEKMPYLFFTASCLGTNSNFSPLCWCPTVAGQLQDCERVEESALLSEEDSGEEVHPAGDLPEVLQDVGEQMEDRGDDEIQTGTSPPLVPPKLLPQMSGGDGELMSAPSKVIMLVMLFATSLVCETTWLPLCSYFLQMFDMKPLIGSSCAAGPHGRVSIPTTNEILLGAEEEKWFLLFFFNKRPVCVCAVSCVSDSGPMSLPSHLPNSYLPKEPPPRATESLSSMTLPLRGPLANSSGSPHLGNMIHPPMPPSCIMEELQRAFASKNRQERWESSAWPRVPDCMGAPEVWKSDGFFFNNIQYVFF